jgi:hypothetical protein
MWKATLRPITGLLPTHQLQGDVKWRIYLDPLCLSFFYTLLEQPCKQTQNGRNMYDIYIYVDIYIYIYTYHTLYIYICMCITLCNHCRSAPVYRSLAISLQSYGEELGNDFARGAIWPQRQNVVRRRESPCAPAKICKLKHIYIYTHTYYMFHFLTMFGGRNIHVPQLF